MVKFNQIQYADCNILKKYYVTIDLGHKTRKHLLKKEILCQIVSFMDYITEKDLNMISKELNNSHRIMDIKRFLLAKFPNNIKSEDSARKNYKMQTRIVYGS